MEIKIKKLSKELIEDFLYFFDEKAFSDNPQWGHCYCLFFHYTGSEADWLKRTKKENRQDAIQLIKSGKLQGFLAYENNIPIGWCNANEKGEFSFNLNRSQVSGLEDQDTISIVCFVIAPEYRRKGVSTKLLNYIIDYYQNTNKKFLEAYPGKNASKDCENYHGPVSLYLKNNFQVIRELDDYSIMRLEL